MTSYHMGWLDSRGQPEARPRAGKRVRPGLCLWAARACGASLPAALPVAASAELLHNFTLVHDDIQDRDRVRRGRPSAWAVWGAAQGINAGDGLFALALRVALGGEACRDGSAGRRPQAAAILVEAALEVIEGQCLDLQQEGRTDTRPADYLRMIEAKTGALLGAALEAGAAIAGAGATQRRRFRQAGRRLGLAFQLRDDWLGIWGDPELTGKSKDGDLARRKLSYPVVAALAAAGPERRRELQDLYEGRDEGSEERIRALLVELGGPDLTRAAGAAWAAEAVAEIAGCGLAAAHTEEFADAATYIAERAG